MSKKVKKLIFPGATLIASIYFSVAFTIGAIIAYISTEVFVKRFIKTGRVKSLIFSFRKWQIHLHHWVIASLIMITALISDSFSLPIFFSGVLGGLIFHDIYTDRKWRDGEKKWYNIIYRK